MDGEEEYGGAQKFQGSGAIPALADEELMGEDDEYDDLYSDVNVGEGFLQMHQSQPPIQPGGVGNGGPQVQRNDVPNTRVAPGGPPGSNIPGVSLDGKYLNRPEIGSGNYPDPHKGIPHDAQARNVGYQGQQVAPMPIGSDPPDIQRRIAHEPAPVPNSGVAGPQGLQQIQPNQVSINPNVNHAMVSQNHIQPLDNGNTVILVGELHWWTTDAELESVCSQYGTVKEIKFFDERASGKSKGYCQVEFYDGAAAAACKEGMNGYVFNGRACVVAFASPETIKQMGASYTSRNQGQGQSQSRRPMNDGMGRGANMNMQSGDGGRNFGRGGFGRGGQGNRGPWGGGQMRGRGGPPGAKNMIGNGIGGGPYGPGLGGPAFGGPGGGLMHPQGMLGSGFDPAFMGHGGYGGFSGPGFPGMLPSFPGVNAMGMAGVAPHVNPAFFGRGMVANGMGMMGSSAMDGPHSGMWSDTSMGGRGGEEQSRRTRESSYGGEDGGSEYGYGEENNEKSVRSSREKERASERDWSGPSDRRHHDERGQDRDRGERERRYRDEKESYRDHRHRERDSGYEDDYDRGQSSSRSRSRSRAMPEDDHRPRSREADYGKRRRGE